MTSKEHVEWGWGGGGQPEPHLPPAPVDGEKLSSPQSLPLDSGEKQQSFISHLQVNLSTIQVDSIQVYFFSKKQQDTSYGKGGGGRVCEAAEEKNLNCIS